VHSAVIEKAVEKADSFLDQVGKYHGPALLWIIAIVLVGVIVYLAVNYVSGRAKAWALVSKAFEQNRRVTFEGLTIDPPSQVAAEIPAAPTEAEENQPAKIVKKIVPTNLQN